MGPWGKGMEKATGAGFNSGHLGCLYLGQKEYSWHQGTQPVQSKRGQDFPTGGLIEKLYSVQPTALV